MRKKLLFLWILFLGGTFVRNPCSSQWVFSVAEERGDYKEKEYKVKVKGIVFDRMTQNPVCILMTEDESKFVPIWIGFAEAMAIDMVMKNIKPPRPMTHDLMKDIIEKLGGKVERVSVTDLRENTYFAYIKVRVGDKVYYIDSRPSDAIALALRTGSPIYITQKILDVSIKVPATETKIFEVLGVSFQIITPELESFFGSKGIVISNVEKGSPADGKLKRGDIIVQINGKTIYDEEDIREVLRSIKEQKSKVLELSILRKGKKEKVSIDIPKEFLEQKQ